MSLNRALAWLLKEAASFREQSSHKVNIDDFCTPDGKYFDFDMLSEAIGSGKLKPIREKEREGK